MNWLRNWLKAIIREAVQETILASENRIRIAINRFEPTIAVHSAEYDAVKFAVEKQLDDPLFQATNPSEETCISEALTWAGHYLNAIGYEQFDRNRIKAQIALKFKAKSLGV